MVRGTPGGVNRRVRRRAPAVECGPKCQIARGPQVKALPLGGIAASVRTAMRAPAGGFIREMRTTEAELTGARRPRSPAASAKTGLADV